MNIYNKEKIQSKINWKDATIETSELYKDDYDIIINTKR